VNWLANLVTRNPKTVLFSLLAVLVFAGLQLPKVQFRYSMRNLYAYTGNKELEGLDAYMDEFGDDGGFVAAILESDALFSHEVLTYIKRTSRALEGDPLFWRVRSLSTRQVPWGEGDEVNTHGPTPPVQRRPPYHPSENFGVMY